MNKLTKMENKLYNLRWKLESLEPDSYLAVDITGIISKLVKQIRIEQSKLSVSKNFHKTRKGGTHLTPPKRSGGDMKDKHLLSPKKRGKRVFNPYKYGTKLGDE